MEHHLISDFACKRGGCPGRRMVKAGTILSINTVFRRSFVRHFRSGARIMADETAFSVRRPQPNRAKRLAKEAHQLCLQQRFNEALPLVERTIRCDHINALNEYILFRTVISEQLDNSKPLLSMRFYNHAKLLQQQGRFRDTKVAYLESYRLDRKFLWPINNLAWLLATSKHPRVRDGREALKHAKLACRKSRYNCWAFVSTLAAAYAELGHFKGSSAKRVGNFEPIFRFLAACT